MYHPAIYRYIERYRADYGHLVSDKAVFETIKRSLDSSEEIMELNWATLSTVLGIPSGMLSRVYQFGWNKSADTQKLHKKLRELVYGAFTDKSLEDYL